MKAMRANTGMCKASPLLLAALSVAVAGCSGNKNNGSAASAPPGTLAVSAFSPSSAIQGSQTSIALDPVNQAIWVPSYTLDSGGNLQYELISTAAAVSNGTATGSKTVSLTGCDTPIGIAYASSISAFLVECGNSNSLALYLSAVDAGSLAVTAIATPGLTWNGNYGGVIFDPQHDQAFVAGSQNVGLLQVPAGGAPSFNANSVTTLPSGSAVSMAMDFTTQQVVIADPSTPQAYLVDASTVNTAAPALSITQLPPINLPDTGQFPPQGAAFDSATGVLAVSSDQGPDSPQTFNGFYPVNMVAAYNMPTYNPNPSSDPGVPTVDTLVVQGFAEYYFGPYLNTTSIPNSTGGLASVNAATHQVLVADAWGPNLLLMHFPLTAPGPTGSLDNYGQLNSLGLPTNNPALPDANSVYPIAQALVWPQTTGTPKQLNVIGTPPALAIDQVNNIAYVLTDDSSGPHTWNVRPAGVFMALVSVDLSAPVLGGCTGPNGFCATIWTPRAAQAVVP